ncbi:MAG: RNA methyltransferase [Chlamydiales bacterium]
MLKITSTAHPEVKRLVKLRENRKFRHQEGSVLISGNKMVREYPFPLTTCIATEENAINFKAEKTLIVNEAVMRKITGLVQPEPLAAEVGIPQPSVPKHLTRVLVLDRIQDPGNLGTLIRTSVAFGWEMLFLLDSCCDPYNDKALRAAKGATFHLPIFEGSLEELRNLIDSHSLTPLIAAGNGESLGTFHEIQRPLLILGNEAQGVASTLQKLGKTVAIPMHQGVESLNVAVAGAIMMYQFRNKTGESYE